MNPQTSKHKRLQINGAWRRGFPWADYAASAYLGLPCLLVHPVLYCGCALCLKMHFLLTQCFTLVSQWGCKHTQVIFLYILTKAGQNSLLMAKWNIPYEKVSSKNKTIFSYCQSKKCWILKCSRWGKTDASPRDRHLFAMGWETQHQGTELGCSKKIWLDLFGHVPACQQMQQKKFIVQTQWRDRTGTYSNCCNPVGTFNLFGSSNSATNLLQKIWEMWGCFHCELRLIIIF